ncbi:MAG: NAD(P)/FAD-dependent oxidoreductase [archaeon]
MNFDTSFDVIIVGAGPGGLMAAKTLAEKKLKVLVLDKKQEIGVPKRCAEAVERNLFEKLLGFNAFDRWISSYIKGVGLYAPSSKSIKVRLNDRDGFVLERKMFEKDLAKITARKGARIQVKTMVKEVERINEGFKVKGSFIGEEVEYSCKLLVAADGIESQIAQQVGLKTVSTLYHTDSGMQYEMAGINPGDTDLIHLFFGNDIAPRGYCWVFPKGKDSANVGIGIGASEKKTAKYYLDKFVESQENLKNGSIIEVNAGGIPVGGFLEKMVSDNFVVVGDAAHQVNPIHGGGILLAMHAGSLAGEIISEAFSKGDLSEGFLKIYQEKWLKEKGEKLKKVLKTRTMFEKFTDDDFEIIANALTAEDVIKITSGSKLNIAGTMAKKLIKHPKLMKLIFKGV